MLCHLFPELLQGSASVPHGWVGDDPASDPWKSKGSICGEKLFAASRIDIYNIYIQKRWPSVKCMDFDIFQ